MTIYAHRVARVAALALMALGSLAAAQTMRTLLSDVIVTGAGDGADVSLIFTCPAHYLSHTPEARGRNLVLQLDATDLCGGLEASMLGAGTQRVRAGELANLVEVEYDGEAVSGPQLTLHFSQEMEFRVQSQTNLRELVVSVSMPAPQRVAPAAVPATGRFVINLRSTSQAFTTADLETVRAHSAYTAYQTQSEVQGRTWYRLRIGFFETEKDAKAASEPLRADFPGLWVAFAEDSEVQAALAQPLLTPGDTVVASVPAAAPSVASASGELAPAAAAEADSPEKRAALLEEGKRALAAGELSQSVQIFTKILQKTDDETAQVAQELLGVARERNGQSAHAKAAYEQYLERYPDGEGAARVRQRLAALTASTTSNKGALAATRPATQAARSNPWDFDTALWQYYQRQESQVNDDPSLLSGSALLSNVDLDVRRAGARVDLQTRVSLGYWYDFMTEDGPGNEDRISSAYVEADGHAGRWRARMGRQSRGIAGVLGRFDGMLFSYEPRERITLNVVGGYPVYSTRDGFDRTREFEGFSVDIADVGTAWDLSGFFNQQTADGILDRQAVGTEARYFDNHRSLYALVDYDVSYGTLNNVYLVGNWRTAGDLTMSATVNRSHSPYLTTSNALMGQPLTSIDELLALETEDRIRQLALDRTATSTTYNMGLSRPFLQKWQVNADVTSTAYSKTVASGGVEGFPASDYRYYSISLLGQSLIKEGDMGSVTFSFGDTTSYQVSSLSLDGRYPLRALRLNPRLRVDRRTRLADGSSEWIYTPMLRMQLQWSRRYYFEFEGGLYLSNHELDATTEQFRTTFFNLGYRYVF